MTLKKTCNRCGKTKPASEFYFDSQNRDRLRGNCKVCHREHTKLNYCLREVVAQ